jgi:hypothetical protein
MSYYQEASTRKCLEEDCYQRWSGEVSEFNKVEDGHTMKFTNLSLLSYFLEEQLGLILGLDFHQKIGRLTDCELLKN